MFISLSKFQFGLIFFLLALTLSSAPVWAQRVWPVDVSGQDYLPNQLTVWSGDTIEFCNQGQWRRQPYSTNKVNPFGERVAQNHEMLKKGDCLKVMVKNPGSQWLKFTIRDAVKPKVRLKVKVNPG